MPKLSPNAVPSYRLHKQSGRAIVTLDGRDHLLPGLYDSAQSRAGYDRLVGEWVANGRRALVANGSLSIAELIVAFWDHATAYYRTADGQPSTEIHAFRSALRPLRRLYAQTRASEFGPLALKSVRQAMVEMGWCRGQVNKQVSRLKGVFKWAVENELIPSSVHHGLIALGGLRKGRSAAKDSDPVVPVPQTHVDAALPYLSRPIVAMIRLQLVTGMRPGEACAMRGIDIDTTGKLWVYTPASHKTEHHGHQRVVYLGPRAQEVVRPFLKTDLHAHLFSPAEAEVERRAKLTAARKTPLSCGNVPGSNRKAKAKRPPRGRYSVASYRRAIARGCDAADLRAKAGWVIDDDERLVPRWHPHQLRHNAATWLRKEYGLEAAQVILGHKTLSVTQVYAEKNVEAARRIMGEVG